MLVEPSTPTRNARSGGSRSDTFRSITPTTPTAPRKWVQKASPTATVIFCCQDCNGFMTDKEPFADFALAASKGITAVESWAKVVIHSVGHLIELIPALEISNPKLSARYFACMLPAHEYREVDQNFFEYCKENTQATFVMRSWFNCAEHHHGCQLSRFDCSELVKEAVGLKEAELSPQQFSREKRKIMVRKISYGRNDQIEELARRLSNAKKEDIDAVSRRLSFGRKEEVAEVAKRLSCSKEFRGEEVDLHLARVSMYYSDPDCAEEQSRGGHL